MALGSQSSMELKMKRLLMQVFCLLEQRLAPKKVLQRSKQQSGPAKKKKEIVERKAIPLGLAKLVVPHKMLGTVGEPQKALSLAWNAPSWSLGQGKAAAKVQQQCLDGRDAR